MTAPKPTVPMGDQIVRKAALQAEVRPIFERAVDLVLPRESHRALLQAEAVLEAADRDAEAIRQQAYQQGIAEAVRRAASLLAEAERERESILRQAQDEIATLALAVARKLVGEWLAESPERMTVRVAHLLDAAGSAREVVIHVGPASGPTLAAAGPELSQQLSGARVRVEVDARLEPGDCVIETNVGRIDARLDVQFEALRAALASDVK